jgi:hypothetical protein
MKYSKDPRSKEIFRMCRAAGLGDNRSCMAETQGELRVNAAGWSTAIIRLLHSVDPVFIFSFIFSFSHSISWRVAQFSLDSRERESQVQSRLLHLPFAKVTGLLQNTERKNLEGFNWKPLKDTRISAKRIAFEDCPKGNVGV